MGGKQRMVKRFGGSTVIVALIGIGLAQPAVAQDSGPGRSVGRFAIELEAGPVWQSRNDVRIPNETGTQFSLVDLVGSGPYFAYRLYASWEIGERHGLRLLIAPLTISADASLDEPVAFAGEAFEAGAPTDATYRFNSYRLTYRYRLLTGEMWKWDIGFTAKIRDAKVALQQDQVVAEDANVGFVPLLHVAAQVQIADRWRLVGDLDGLVAPQGRAEDLALKLSYDAAADWSFRVGYRTLEGGADSGDVYTFAWFHYVVFSVEYRF